MKWIDQQDDYFLRDFNDKNDGEKDKTGETPATEPEDVTDVTETESKPAEKGQEFSFTDTVEPSGEKTDTQAPSGQPGTPEQPRRKRHRGRKFLAWTIFIVLLGLALWGYIYYYVPYTSDTITTGYITSVEKQGLFFKTYEGEMVAEHKVSDPTSVTERDFFFSIPDDSLARVIQSYQGTGKRVTLTTEKFYGRLPWRGNRNVVAVSIKE